MAWIGAKRCPWREDAIGFDMGIQRQADLLQIISALRAAASLPASLDRRQQQRYQGADNRDHDKKLHKREPARLATNR